MYREYSVPLTKYKDAYGLFTSGVLCQSHRNVFGYLSVESGCFPCERFELCLTSHFALLPLQSSCQSALCCVTQTQTTRWYQRLHTLTRRTGKSMCVVYVQDQCHSLLDTATVPEAENKQIYIYNLFFFSPGTTD